MNNSTLKDNRWMGLLGAFLKDMGRRMIIWVHWVVFEKRSFDTARCILGIEPMGLVAKVRREESKTGHFGPS